MLGINYPFKNMNDSTILKKAASKVNKMHIQRESMTEKDMKEEIRDKDNPMYTSYTELHNKVVLCALYILNIGTKSRCAVSFLFSCFTPGERIGDTNLTPVEPRFVMGTVTMRTPRLIIMCL